MEKYTIGIDVDKKTNKVCLIHLQDNFHKKIKGQRTFSNQLKGYQELLKWCDKHVKDHTIAESFVMEATGVYHEQLAYFLHAAKKTVHIVLPLKAKRYLQSLGIRSKTDKIDARGLALMGCEQQLTKWEPGSCELIKLRSLTRQIEALKNQKTVLNNQLEAAHHMAVIHSAVIKSLKKLIRLLDKELLFLQASVQQTITNDETLRQQFEYLTPLKGVGLMTFAVIASETNGFALFKNQGQLVCYTGYDVIEHQSGQKRGKTKISKKGNAHIRRILHMASLSVVKLKVAPFYQLYERVKERTGIKMKGYVAVQRKLLLMLYTLWKKQENFEPNYNQAKTTQHNQDEQESKGQIQTSGKHETKYPLSVALSKAEKQPFLEEKAALDQLPFKQKTEVLFR